MSDSPEAIEPDTKDWTWVLERPCPDCGFDSSRFGRDDVRPLTLEAALTLSELMDDPRVADRSRPDRWSALEYCCHVRDVFRLFAARLNLMLETDDPLFANWEPDSTAVEDRYGAQNPVIVKAELLEAGEIVAEMFGAVRPHEWARPGRRSDGAAFTVESFARYFLHDPVHHIWDVETGFAALERRGLTDG